MNEIKKRNQAKSKDNNKDFKYLLITVCWLITFIVWTIAVKCIDLKAIGPNESVVGFATLNGFFHKLTGVHMMIYTITDWLGLVPICTALGFGILGLVQLINRRSIKKVDSDILILGGFYIIVLGAYILFEIVAINYRPVLIEGCLEASYPSSTTLLTMCVMPTAIMQLKSRIKSNSLKHTLSFILILFTIFMVGGRLFSGVHWFSDIIGGGILSVGLVLFYYTVNSIVKNKYKQVQTIIENERRR